MKLKAALIYWREHNQNIMKNIVRKLTWNSFWKKIAVDGDMMIDKGTGEFTGPEYWLYLLLTTDQQAI